MTEAFRRTRKHYIFFSGLLIAWELVGLRLPEDGKISSTIDIELLSPNAAPFVLIALIVYFAFRTALEWRYCSPPKEHQKIAGLDYWSAHGIAVAALGLFAFQRLLQMQIANEVDLHDPQSILGMYFGFLPGASFIAWEMFKDGYQNRSKVSLAFAAFTVVVIAVGGLDGLKDAQWHITFDTTFLSFLGLGTVLSAAVVVVLGFQRAAARAAVSLAIEEQRTDSNSGADSG